MYELNPVVLKIAENQFTYLSESKARVEPVLGDGRLSLEDEIADGEFDRLAQRFDILSLDAFSGDGIPLHLLTRGHRYLCSCDQARWSDRLSSFQSVFGSSSRG